MRKIVAEITIPFEETLYSFRALIDTPSIKTEVHEVYFPNNRNRHVSRHVFEPIEFTFIHYYDKYCDNFFEWAYSYGQIPYGTKKNIIVRGNQIAYALEGVYPTAIKTDSFIDNDLEYQLQNDSIKRIVCVEKKKKELERVTLTITLNIDNFIIYN